MTTNGPYSWQVEATVPGDVWKHPTTGAERPTTKNLNLLVVAYTLDEAVNAVKHRFRDTTVTFLKVMRHRTIDNVIVAGEVP